MQNAPPEGEARPRKLARLFAAVPIWTWAAFAALAGAVIGLGAFTFAYAQGFSYLSNDPASCVNCHIMREQWDGWNAGSHKAVATCNDCHTPHNNVVSKYAVKALNGFRHSYAFTTGNFHEPIQITALNRSVTEHACLYCHGELTTPMSHADSDDPTDCLRCHQGVGHGK
jgi:cytochrome c nitrite reductase small subunit